MNQILYPSGDREETAYHESGHATIELIHNSFPQMLMVMDHGDKFTGSCFSCSNGVEQAPWRGEKAVAGVLAQALFVAKRNHAGCAIKIQSSEIDALVRFFVTPPDGSSSCIATMDVDDRSLTTRVDLRSWYSNEDYWQFKVAISEIAKTQHPGKAFLGQEPEFVSAAKVCVERCIGWLNDPTVWQTLSKLAQELLKSQPVRAQIIRRDDMLRVTRGLPHAK